MKNILYILSSIVCVFAFFSIQAVLADGDISDEGFTIDVTQFTPGWTQFLDEDSDTSSTVNNVLVTVLEKLIIIFWVLSAFIMTIGAGYMIIYHGQDEFLSKWKSIFMSGIIALAVALSAWVIVRLFAYILY